MRHQSVSVGTGAGPDWKGLGYLVSIVSVFFLGAVAWPGPEEPRWHGVALILGVATSILGMGFRYLAHLHQQREMQRTKAEARSN